MTRFNILTNDPSMTAWGWAVVNTSGAVLKTGCIKTEPSSKKLHIRKGDDRTRRVSEINKELLKIIDEYDVKYILSELPHGSQNASAAVMIGMVVGVLQTIADILDIGIEWYSEGDSKNHLLGKRSATKEETINKIRQIYGKPRTGIKYMDEAIADALSIHHIAFSQSSTLRLIKN